MNNDQYPGSKEAANSGSGLKSSLSTTLVYIYSSDDNSYCLAATNTNGIVYHITSTNQMPTEDGCPGASAGSFVMAWGGSGSDYGNSLVQTSDGGYAVTGLTTSYGAGNDDMFLAKYAANGSLSWSKTWGGSGSDYGNSLVKTSDGGYAVTGYTESYGDNGDMFIAKYAANGSLSWNKIWGSTGCEEGHSLVQTSDGGYAVTGYTNSYGGSNTNTNVSLVKYDSSGNLSWSRTWGGTDMDEPYSIIQTSDGGYAVTGFTASYGAGNFDAFLLKYAANGDFSWNKTWGGTDYDYGSSLVQTSDGNYVIAGYTASYGAGNGDMFIVKFATNGSLSWSKTWGGSGDQDYGNSLVRTSDGGYAVTGYTINYGAGGSDMFLVKYNSSGDLSWDATMGGAGEESGNSLIQTSDDGYVVTGSIGSYGAGDSDMFLAKYASDGLIAGCNSPMCQIPSADVDNPSAGTSSPTTANKTSPTATESIPAATKMDPTAIETTIVPAQ